MPARFDHLTAILVGTETTYGTAAVLTGAAHAILARRAPTWTPLEGTDDQIDNLRAFLGGQGTRLNQNVCKCVIEVDAGGAGAAGTAAPYNALLRACGLSQTLVATTSATYAPVSSAFESATIVWHDHLTSYQMTGARGTCRFIMEAGKRPYFRFELTGLIGSIADAALPVTTLTAFREPLPGSATNTPTFQLHGYSCIVERLEIDLGNTIQPRMLIGSESVVITDRRSTGTLVIEADTVAGIDWVSRARASTRGALAVTHGTVAGNILAIAAPAVEIGRPTFGTSNGIRNVSLPLEFCASGATGNDELSFVIR